MMIKNVALGLLLMLGGACQVDSSADDDSSAEGGSTMEAVEREVGTYVEVVRFSLNEGVADATLLDAETAIREGRIQDQPGYLGREIHRDDAGEWLTIIYWESKDAADAWTPVFQSLEEGQTFGSLLDFENARQEHYTKMLPSEDRDHTREIGTYTEIGRLELADGVTDDELLDAENAIRAGRIQDQPGYLGRDLYLDDAGGWLVTLYWESKEAGDAWTPVFQESEEGQAFIALLDFDNLRQEHYSQALP